MHVCVLLSPNNWYTLTQHRPGTRTELLTDLREPVSPTALQYFERFPGTFGVLRVVTWLLRAGGSLCSTFPSVFACSLLGCSWVRSSKAAELMLGLTDGTSKGSFRDTPRCPLPWTLWSTVPNHQLHGGKEPMCFFQACFCRVVAFWQRDEAGEMCTSIGGFINCTQRAECPNKGQRSNTAAEPWIAGEHQGLREQKMSNGDKELKDRKNE